MGTPARVARLRAPRPFVVRGSKRTVRAAILTFRLPRRAVVVFDVRRLAPSCRTVGTFRVRGHAGRNRVRFTGRVRGRLLTPGTYELRARGLPDVRVRVAILPRGSSASDAAEALRAASTCPSESVLLAASAGTTGLLVGGDAAVGPDGGQTTGGVASASSGSPETQASPGSTGEGRTIPSVGGALGTISRGAREAGPLGLALILCGIAAAILLLGTASLPQTAARGPRLAALVADRRLELALAGVVTLVVVTLAYLVSVS
jgi:hypothetical protein